MQLDPFVITLRRPFDASYHDISSQKYQDFTAMVIQTVSVPVFSLLCYNCHM